MVKVVAVARLPSWATDSAAIHPVIAKAKAESPAKITRSVRRVLNPLSATSAAAREFSPLSLSSLTSLTCLPN